MQNRQLWINFGTGAFLILAAFFVTRQSTVLTEHQIFPVFSAQLFNENSSRRGGALDPASLAGKPIIVHFGATWCEACKTERPQLEALASQYANTPVKLLIVATADTQGSLEKSEFGKELGATVLVDPKSAISKLFDVENLPQTLVFDGNGKLATKVDHAMQSKDVVMIQKKIGQMADQLPVISRVPEFAFKSSSGNSFSSSALDSHVWVADFVFTKCQSVCPTLTQRMKDLQEDFRTSKDLRLVSFSVDPENDTPEALKKYQNKFQADAKRWFFLTDDWTKIHDLLSQGFGLGVPGDPVFHTDRFVLIDRKMQIRGYYPTETKSEFKKLQTHIAYLLAQS